MSNHYNVEIPLNAITQSGFDITKFEYANITIQGNKIILEFL